MLAVDTVTQELSRYYTVIPHPDGWEIQHSQKLVEGERFITLIMRGLGKNKYRYIHQVAVLDKKVTILSNYQDMDLTDTLGCVKAFHNLITVSTFSVKDIRTEKELYVCDSYVQCQEYINQKKFRNVKFYLKIEWEV